MKPTADDSRQNGSYPDSAELRVLIADDHPLFAEALTVTLECDERIEVVGRARNGQEAIDLASSLHPDVVLMDLDMPVLDGIEGTRGVLEASPESRVVVVTSSTSPDDERLAREAGAQAYVKKGGFAAELFSAIFEKPGRSDEPSQPAPPLPPRRRRRGWSPWRLRRDRATLLALAALEKRA